MKHYVYRCYDAEGVLLYIGCSRDVEGRMAVHLSNWFNPASVHLRFHMDRYDSVEYPDKETARRAERESIAAEAPLLNVHYNQGRGLARVPVEPPTAEQMADARVRFNELLHGTGWGESA